jgi:gliding motility-associated protein GldL
MANQKKGRIDPITFIYGFGAAVILIGSMFKFIGWDYANELFIAGLSIEAVVFLISAFEKTEDEKEYNWEKVFPQLTSDAETGSNNGEESGSYQEAMQHFSGSIRSLSEQITLLNGSLEGIRKEMAASAVKGKQMHERMEELNNQFDEYTQHMQKMNAKYKEFLSKGRV